MEIKQMINLDKRHSFYETIDEDLKCGISFGVILNPKICSNFQTSYCKDCIE